MFTILYFKISLCIITIIIEYFGERIGRMMGRKPARLEQVQRAHQEGDEDKEEVEDTRKSRQKPLDVAELAKKLKAEQKAEDEKKDAEWVWVEEPEDEDWELVERMEE